MSAASSAALEWSWYRLFEAPGEAPSWLTEVRELRARVIFANGQRPAFGSNGARQGDRDEIDFYSTHIVARLRGAIAGCVRLTPLVASLPSVTEQMIGKAKLRELLATLGADASKTVEHGRWVADPAYKQLGTGVYLMAASFAVAYKLGFPFSVATATSGVVPLLERVGARRVPGIPLLHSDVFDDDEAILYGHQREFSPKVLAEFQRMAARMGFELTYRKDAIDGQQLPHDTA